MKHVGGVPILEQIDHLVMRYEEVSHAYRLRAMNPAGTERAELRQFADYLSNKGRTLKEQAHRFGPLERLELVVTATTRLESAIAHLHVIDRANASPLEAEFEVPEHTVA